MLVTRIFSFSHNVFKCFLSQGRLQLGLCCKGLSYQNLTVYYPINPDMLCYNPHFSGPWVKSLLKTLWEKEKMLVTSNLFNLFIISGNFLLSSVNAFSFEQSRILLCAKEHQRVLKTLYVIHLFYNGYKINYVYSTNWTFKLIS